MTVVIPAVPKASLTQSHNVADGSTPTQRLAVSAGGNASANAVATTLHTGAASSSSSTAAVAAGTAANTVISANAGRLCRVMITTAGTTANSCLIYDNATEGSGVIIGAFLRNTAVGTIKDFQLPAANGITVAGNAANPAMTISFM